MITLINYSKSASNTFRLNDYIQFTLSVGAYSIDDFNTKLEQQSYNKSKTRNHFKSKTLSSSLKKTMHLPPTISFSLYLEHVTITQLYKKDFFLGV